jgi:outer membrane murein-binding lipoprotein Lpp
MPALTGDVTTSAGTVATTIAAGVVTYAKMQNISATARVLGRKTAGAGSTEELTFLMCWI